MCTEAGLLDAHACTVPSMATDNTRQQAPRMEERGGQYHGSCFSILLPCTAGEGFLSQSWARRRVKQSMAEQIEGQMDFSPQRSAASEVG